MFNQLIYKISEQKKLYQSEVDRKFIQYKQSLAQKYELQRQNYEMIKKAQEKYNQVTIGQQTIAKSMGEFNQMVSTKLKKYDPEQCIDNPDDLFQELQQQQNKLKDAFTRKMDQLFRLNPEHIADKGENKSNINDDNKEDTVIARCTKCSKAITVDNVRATKDVGGAIEHISCDESGNGLYINKFVSSISQYSLDATGSCTINALEAAIQLQMGREPSIELVDEIVNLAALYKQDKHTAVSDIFPAVSRYSTNLEQVDWMQITVKDIENIINRMTKILQNKSSSTNCVSAVLTKPPETIFMHYDFKIDIIYIYDSHPRPQLDGSHFLVFKERKCVEKYLQSMWPYQHLGAGFRDLRSQLINMLDVTLFQLKAGAKPSRTPNLELMGLELATIGVSLEEKWQQTYGHNNGTNNFKSRNHDHNRNGNGSAERQWQKGKV